MVHVPKTITPTGLPEGIKCLIISHFLGLRHLLQKYSKDRKDTSEATKKTAPFMPLSFQPQSVVWREFRTHEQVLKKGPAQFRLYLIITVDNPCQLRVTNFGVRKVL